jgi:hypothetical protein
MFNHCSQYSSTCFRRSPPRRPPPPCTSPRRPPSPARAAPRPPPPRAPPRPPPPQTSPRPALSPPRPGTPVKFKIGRPAKPLPGQGSPALDDHPVYTVYTVYTANHFINASANEKYAVYGMYSECAGRSGHPARCGWPVCAILNLTGVPAGSPPGPPPRPGRPPPPRPARPAPLSMAPVGRVPRCRPAGNRCHGRPIHVHARTRRLTTKASPPCRHPLPCTLPLGGGGLVVLRGLRQPPPPAQRDTEGRQWYNHSGPARGPSGRLLRHGENGAPRPTNPSQ